MGKRVTNVNNGGTVGTQSADTDDDKDTTTSKVTKVTNVNNGGVVGIQCANGSNNNVVIVGEW